MAAAILSEEWQKQVLLWLWDYIAWTMLGHVVLAFAFSVWLYRRLRTSYPDASPYIPHISILFFVFLLVGLLMINDIFTRQAPAIRAEQIAAQKRQDDEANATRQRLADEARRSEEASPEYIQKKIMNWLDKHKYATQSLPLNTNDVFRIRATADQDFTIFQQKSIPGNVTIFTAFSLQQAYLKRWIHLPLKQRNRLRLDLQLALLPLGPQNGFEWDEKKGVFSISLWTNIQMDGTTTREQFISQLWMLKRGTAMVDLMTQRFFE